MELQCRPGRISTRGYYYDTETGLYYLQSRYYDATTGRFINADDYASTGQDFIGTNSFAFCLNNPVNYVDVGGSLAIELGLLLAAGGTLLIAGITVLAYALESNPSTYQTRPPEIYLSPELIYAFTAIALVAGYAQELTIEPDAKVGEKEKVGVLEAPKNRAFFTVNPSDFHPRGLIMTQYSGSYNGMIIKWKDPITGSIIFEWDEDLSYGSHYHTLSLTNGKHTDIHYLPGTPVPEPLNTIYF